MYYEVFKFQSAVLLTCILTMVDMSNDFLSLQKPSASNAGDLETVPLRSVDMEAPDEPPGDGDSKVPTRAKRKASSSRTPAQVRHEKKKISLAACAFWQSSQFADLYGCLLRGATEKGL